MEQPFTEMRGTGGWRRETRFGGGVWELSRAVLRLDVQVGCWGRQLYLQAGGLWGGSAEHRSLQPSSIKRCAGKEPDQEWPETERQPEKELPASQGEEGFQAGERAIS